jgi:hypothetical protein
MLDDKLRHEITKVSKVIIQQNYFQFLDSFFIQEIGLAMGSLTSSIFSVLFLQHSENTAIFDILVHNNIMWYFRYVDDILIMYNDTVTNIQDVFESFNDITPSIKFTMEKETENRINFLDVTIRKEQNTFTFNVYRKPTTTDSIIRLDSCHPQEHKHAAMHHLISRMTTYNLNAADKEEERNINT